jgi:medium-chain acyl-[acyl-carrier-protein] hydrolase
VPAELFERPEALRILLPALKADARLYRRYVYDPAPPLEIPIIAYYGRTDPNVRSEHVERWREQSTGHFERREFEGGHFYLQSQRDAFLTGLVQVLG